MVFPAYALPPQRAAYAKAVNGLGQASDALSESWLNTGVPPTFEVTQASVNEDARIAANMWMKAPANKMTIASVQQGVDADGDGQIDKTEFKELLRASGYTGKEAAALFAKIDKDGDGTLTQAEIKLLSQGSATLQSAG
jgi:hypothetical protein